VTDEQTAALRALLVDDMDTHHLLFARPGVGKAGYTALVTAAFCEAAERRFGARHDAADLAGFVADVRSRSNRLASDIDPLIAERVIRAVFGSGSVGDLSDAVAGPRSSCSARWQQMSILTMPGWTRSWPARGSSPIS
jgi:hypothetical protein